MNASPVPPLTDIGAALEWARRELQRAGKPEESGSAQVILANIFSSPRATLLAHPEQTLTEEQALSFRQSISRLLAGEPLAYITGEQEFFGLPFFVSPDVLIPRPETECLVERAIAFLEERETAGGRITAADIGTGSGCIAVALAHALPELRVVAADISVLALGIAKRNILRHGLHSRVELVCSDLGSVLRGPFTLLCANLPYIPSNELARLEALKYEPASALSGGEDGLRLVEQLLRDCRRLLAPDGLALFEIDSTSGEAAIELAKVILPYSDCRVQQDYSGRDRILEVRLRT